MLQIYVQKWNEPTPKRGLWFFFGHAHLSKMQMQMER